MDNAFVLFQLIAYFQLNSLIYDRIKLLLVFSHHLFPDDLRKIQKIIFSHNYLLTTTGGTIGGNCFLSFVQTFSPLCQYVALCEPCD